MAQIKAMDGGSISSSRRLKKRELTLIRKCFTTEITTHNSVQETYFNMLELTLNYQKPFK